MKYHVLSALKEEYRLRWSLRQHVYIYTHTHLYTNGDTQTHIHIYILLESLVVGNFFLKRAFVGGVCGEETIWNSVRNIFYGS